MNPVLGTDIKIPYAVKMPEVNDTIALILYVSQSAFV